MPFARAPDHPKEATRSGVGIVGEAGSHISNISHLCNQGSTQLWRPQALERVQAALGDLGAAY